MNTKLNYKIDLERNKVYLVDLQGEIRFGRSISELKNWVEVWAKEHDLVRLEDFYDWAFKEYGFSPEEICNCYRIALDECKERGLIPM